MTMGDRIQSLRKTGGISQEELADKIGVSRQAVSKWESEQSSPDLEKIILLSDYFEVTTDYLLKGIEPKTEMQEKNGQDARIFSAGGTALNTIGLITAVMVWAEERTSVSVAIGFLFFAIGCLLYAIGQFLGENKIPARKWFVAVNVWIILLMPVSSLFNLVQGIFGGYWWCIAPFPQWYNSFAAIILCWLCYVGVCIFVDVMVFAKDKKASGYSK